MKTKLLCLFTAAIVLTTTTLVVRAAVPPAENLLPADTFLFFTVPDCDALRAAARAIDALYQEAEAGPAGLRQGRTLRQLRLTPGFPVLPGPP